MINQIVADAQIIRDLKRALATASALLEQIEKTPSTERGAYAPQAVSDGRNPLYFRETGHLSDDGIKALYGLFDQGLTIEEAAKEMGISIRGAAGRRSAWLKAKARKHG